MIEILFAAELAVQIIIGSILVIILICATRMVKHITTAISKLWARCTCDGKEKK
jgi:hypothetical protein